MKNLIPYNKDCFDIHKKAVNKKQTGEIKEQLINAHKLVEAQYKKYSNNFKLNSIGLIEPDTELKKIKDALLSLYSYQSKVIQEFRSDLRDMQIKTIITTCQNCTIDTVNTLDHIVPKAKYPEFIVNPINLFPCCSTCNSHKLNSTEDSSGRKFLNLYLDKLPPIQYLFVSITYDAKGNIDFNYFLDNPGNLISSDFFNLLNNHYTKLNLFERFKLKSIEYFSEIESKIRSFMSKLSLEDIVSILMQTIIEEKKAFGDNHWKCILEQTLISDSSYMAKFK